MAENNRLTCTPVLVVDFNAVFGFNRGHVAP
jgi:hypothetical protein